MKLSVIIPIKNQTSLLLDNLQAKIIPYFDSLPNLTYDVLIVPNGSSEAEQAALESGLKSCPAQVKMLPFTKQGAKGRAVKRGIEYSDSDYVLFFDADLATDLSAFSAIYPIIQEYDAFIGDRDMKGSVQNKRPFIRRLGHFGSKALVKLRFHLKGVGDTQCGFKCFKTKVAKLMVKHQIVDGFAFDVEYCYFLCLNGFKIKRIPVRWFNNEAASSVSLASASKQFWADLGRIKKNKNYYFLSPEEKEGLC